MFFVATLAITVGAVAALTQEHAASIEQRRVEFKSLDGETTVSGYLFRQQERGDQPRPAVVMMHGCSGLLDPRGHLFPLYPSWARALTDKGYLVLMVDSATPRGFGQTCSPGEGANTMWQERPKDAYAALLFLQERPFVQADRVALMGWSQGGGVTLKIYPGAVHAFDAPNLKRTELPQYRGPDGRAPVLETDGEAPRRCFRASASVSGRTAGSVRSLRG